MAKPRGHITRSKIPEVAYGRIVEPSISIATWCPDQAAQKPPEQVHFIMHIPGQKFPLVMRFKSPDTLGFLIEELARYRREVWPGAEPLDLKGEQQDGTS